MKGTIRVFPDRETLAFAAAHYFLSVGQAAIMHTGRFMVALSGGSTPRLLFQRLAVPRLQDALEWERVHIFWGDERCVLPDAPESNFRMARETLIDYLPIPEANVHRFMTELAPKEAALKYVEELQTSFGLSAGSPPPSFDLVLLGLGGDGHTASLFPGTDVLGELEQWVAALYVEKLAAWRVTLTPVVLNASKDVLFLVSGRGKAKVVKEVLCGVRRPEDLPAQLIQPVSNNLHWFIDSPAAEELFLRSKERRWHG